MPVNINECFIRILRALVSLGYYDKAPHTGRLREQAFISSSSGDLESQIKVPVDSVCGEGPVVPYPHMAESGKRELQSLPPLVRTLNPSWELHAYNFICI